MTPERHQQIADVYHRVLTALPDRRAAVLDDACAGDLDLRRHVESLLAASDQAGSFLNTPAVEISVRALSADRPVPQQIGKYRILSLLGRGGMGEVYAAEDPALRRTVAIKLLPALLTGDAHAVSRFEQEARAASSLNHPNIVTIHEIGEVEGGRFIAMEFIDGQPLSALVGNPMSAETLMPIARQLAQALTVAHAAGIVHRDIKPANVLLRPDGYVKLLDFGIARLVATSIAGGDGPPTFVTQAGAVIGTPRYMAPEQIRGDAATAASDVYSLGAVLHELLTGRHVSEAYVVPAAPMSRQRAAPLPELIARMLNPDPALRPRASEVEAALRQATAGTTSTFQRRRWLIAGGSAVAIVAVAMALALRNDSREPDSATPVRFQIVPPPNTAFSPSSASLALSPDGRSLAFTASQVSQQAMALWIHSLDSLKARPIPSVKTAGQLFWLADSGSLAFADTSEKFGLRIVDIARESVQRIDNARLGSAGVGSGGRQGLLVKLEGESIIHYISAAGEPPTAVTVLDSSLGERWHAFPAFLPDGRHFLFLASSAQPQHDGIAYIGVLGSTERRPLFRSDSQVVYAHPGFLLYMLGDTLLARPFDPASLRVTGEGIPVAEQVERNSSSRRGSFTVSQTGVLAYRQQNETQLVWYDRSGRRLQTLGPPGHFRNPALSPDGKTIAVGRLEPKTGTWDIWTIDVEKQAPVRITTDPSSEDMPVWSPDGTQIAFKSDRRSDDSPITAYRYRLIGGETDVLHGISAPSATIHMWTKEGLVYSNSIADLDVWLQPPGGAPFKLLATPAWESFAQISPDGKWLAYGSNETGAFEIYVAGLDQKLRKTPISSGGGTEPTWRQDGRELFYLSADRQLMAVPITSGDEFKAGTPRALFQTAVSPLVNSSYTRNQYVMTPDGQRFLMNEPTTRGALAAITVVVNWPATLTRTSR
jgi:serine/threonine protein kinase